jgi:thiol-disulfide isomerase/thioredoxin
MPRLLAAAVVAVLMALIGITLFGSDKAPAIQVKTLDGDVVDLGHPGKPTLVNFWATTCPGCIAEMPHLAKMKQRLGKDFQIVAIAMAYDPIDQVQKYRKAHAYPFLFAHDSTGEIAAAFGGVSLTPTSFLIAPNGNIVYRKIGEVDYDKVEARVRAMLPPR